MADARGRVRLYIYRPTHNRLLEIQQRMVEASGGRQVSIDAVIEALLDAAAEREEAGA